MSWWSIGLSGLSQGVVTPRDANVNEFGRGLGLKSYQPKSWELA